MNWTVCFIVIFCFIVITGIVSYLIYENSEFNNFILKDCKLLQNGTSLCYYYDFYNSSSIKIVKVT